MISEIYAESFIVIIISIKAKVTRFFISPWPWVGILLPIVNLKLLLAIKGSRAVSSGTGKNIF